MDRSRIARLEALEALADIGRVRTVWNYGDTDTQAVIAGMIAAGRGQADDKFIIVSWQTGPEVPVTAADRWAYAPRPGPVEPEGEPPAPEGV